MGASALEARQDDLGRLRPRFSVGLVVEHQRPIISIGNADVAFAGRDIAGDLAVAARWLLREIGFEAAEPFFGLGFTVMGDEGCKQRVVINVLAGANADLALPFRIGEIFVVQGSLLHAILRGIDHARAHRNAVPVPLGIAILGRHDLIEDVRLDGLGDAGPHCVLDPPDIDGEQHIRGAVGTLGLDALFEARACRDDIDLDAGVPAKGVEQRLNELALAVSVNIDVARLGEC